MLPNVSGLSLQRRCVPCGTPVTFRTREEQLQDYLREFVHHETLDEQIDNADCDICHEPLGSPPSTAAGHLSPPGFREWVDFCGHGHYFHRWCLKSLMEHQGTHMVCPDCRRPMSDNLRIMVRTHSLYTEVVPTDPPQRPPTEMEIRRDAHAALAQQAREEEGRMALVMRTLRRLGWGALAADMARNAIRQGNAWGWTGTASAVLAMLLALNSIQQEWLEQEAAGEL